MSLPVFRDADIDPHALGKGPVAIIGYGAQGAAQAKNLRDSGHQVLIGLPASSASQAQARADGFAVATVAEVAAQARTIALMCPDELHAQVVADHIAPHAPTGAVMVLAHGLSVHFGQWQPRADWDVVLVAPKGQGAAVRRLYEQGHGVCALAGVHQDASVQAWARALAYAHGIGAGRAGILQTTLKDECETDLFGEQAVLCGGLLGLVYAGYETLTEAGYAPELAYFECVHELKLVVDLLHRIGPAAMLGQISNAAELGALKAADRLVGPEAKAQMQQLLAEIQSGAFAEALSSEAKSGYPHLNANRRTKTAHDMETVGQAVRDVAMPPLAPSKDSA